MKIKQAETLLESLSTMLECKGVVGYKVARNYRMIFEELKEYHQIKENLFRKYGEEKDGKLIINKFSDNFSKYLCEIEEIENQEVEFSFKLIDDNELEKSDLTSKQMLFLMENFSNEGV